MRLSKLPFCVALSALFFLQISAPTASHADTYQIVGLGADNVQFYGMDDAGHVVFYANWFSCGDPSQGCYEDFLNGAPAGRTSVAPTYAWDYAAGTCVSPQPNSASCAISKNGGSAVIASEPAGEEGLYAYSGSNPPQLLLNTGFGSIFAMNGSGDIVFDNGNLDEWSEAIDLSAAPAPVPTPEPTSILLLGPGAIVFAGMALRRKRVA
jgi:hypothetical protein